MHLGLDPYFGPALWAAEIIVFFLSVLWKPSIGLYLLVPMLPLQTIRYRLHEFPLGAQFIDVLLLGVALGLKRQGRPLFPPSPLNRLLFAYLIFTFVSMIRGSFSLGLPLPLSPSDLRLADWKNFVVVLPLIYFFSLSALTTRFEMRLMLIVINASVLLVAKNFNGYINDRDFSAFSYDLRSAGALGGAGVNGLAAFLAQMGVFLIAFVLIERGLISRVWHLAGAVAGVYCLIFALSRGGYASFLVGLTFLGFRRSKLILVGLVVLLIGWQAVVPGAVRDRVFMTRNSDGQIESSAAARITLWEEAMVIFKGDPVFGIGFNTYRYGSHSGFTDTHNVYLKVLVETGVGGLILFIGIFTTLWRMGLRLYRTSEDDFCKSIGLAFSALMVAAMVGNCFGDRWFYYQITGFTFALGALVARCQLLTDEETEPVEYADESETDSAAVWDESGGESLAPAAAR